jgi:hypothetical protein
MCSQSLCNVQTSITLPEGSSCWNVLLGVYLQSLASLDFCAPFLMPSYIGSGVLNHDKSLYDFRYHNKFVLCRTPVRDHCDPQCTLVQRLHPITSHPNSLLLPQYANLPPSRPMAGHAMTRTIAAIHDEVRHHVESP